MKQIKALILLSVAAIAITGFSTRNTVIVISDADESIKVERIISFFKIAQDIDTSKWVAPASADDMLNPIPVNEETIAEGKLVYRKACRSCHGRNGDGQGVEAPDLSTSSTDFTDPTSVEQSDGSMFWKISEGRNDMLPLKKDLYEEEIWSVINYIRTFSQFFEEKN